MPGNSRDHGIVLLHLMGSAFAIENVSWLTGAFAFAPLRLFIAANVGAKLIAADNLLFGCWDWVFQNFSHFHSLGAGRIGGIADRLILTPLCVSGKTNIIRPAARSPSR